MAEMAVLQGRFNAAIQLAQSAHDYRKRSLGPHHPDTLFAINVIASVRVAAGQLEMGEEIIKELTQLQATHLKSLHHPDALQTVHLACLIMLKQGNLKMVEDKVSEHDCLP